ncbi:MULTISPECIES: SIS domain-containing protein [Peribacillus]|uniref:SIS domain-containing protein n=1 Tax=Peribacillus TaxID=2675229 RepID=UPI001F4DE07E|nr:MULTISPECIES: SIS domain-containing protein [unclassified Peribacillus]MCK1986163.1 SIS domain-containing protein [Peribacillus sp. Aquil_B1]MCK2011364.1 SIS domain-containing protein [Peribacillus sp. Aquil_B8]
MNSYFEEVQALLTIVGEQEKQSIKESVEHIVKAVMSDGIIHLFGSGHSHILTEEVFYRAGGLAAIRPIFVEDLMLFKGASRSSQLERQNGLSEKFMHDEDIRPGDVCIVISSSGVNPVPIDVATIAKEKGAFVIGLTSPEYAKSCPSRHKQKHYLHDVVDLVIDNHIAKGDTLLKSNNIPFGSGSTVVGAVLLNMIFTQVIQTIIESGETPPVFLSSNIEGADEHNQKIIAKYKTRIPQL